MEHKAEHKGISPELKDAYFELMNKVYFHILNNYGSLSRNNYPFYVMVEHNLLDNDSDELLFSATYFDDDAIKTSVLLSDSSFARDFIETCTKVYQCVLDNADLDLIITFVVDKETFSLHYFAYENLISLN